MKSNRILAAAIEDLRIRIDTCKEFYDDENHEEADRINALQMQKLFVDQVNELVKWRDMQ